MVPPKPRDQYELGFRVPLLIVSPYTGTDTQGYVSCTQGFQQCNSKMDFGSILRFIEDDFSLGRIGNGTYADNKAVQLDAGFFTSSTRHFKPISLPAMYSGLRCKLLPAADGHAARP